MKPILLIAVLTVIPFVSLSSADSGAKKCTLIESKEMQQLHKDEKFRLNNMLIFDIRPFSVAEKSKQILSSKLISYHNLETKYLYNIKWERKNIYLVGEDTKSTEEFCQVMIKKDFINNNIYVLTGGIKSWKGALILKFTEDVKQDWGSAEGANGQQAADQWKKR